MTDSLTHIDYIIQDLSLKTISLYSHYKTKSLREINNLLSENLTLPAQIVALRVLGERVGVDFSDKIAELKSTIENELDILEVPKSIKNKIYTKLLRENKAPIVDSSTIHNSNSKFIFINPSHKKYAIKLLSVV